MTPEAFGQFVDSLPEVAEARAVKAEAAAAKAQAQEQQFQTAVQTELEEIKKLNPNITGIPDILAMETAEAFRQNVSKGMNYLEAYKLANFDSLMTRSAERGKRDMQYREKGKEHMGRTTGHGAGGVNVPADILAQYRAFNPGATDDEIRAHYNRAISRKK